MKTAEATFYRTKTCSASGEWLVFVHGATQHSGLFDAQEAWFGSRWNLLLVDLPGHGRSSHMAGPFGVVEYAAAVRGAIAAVGIERFSLWGTHTGAAVGLLLAAEVPQRVRSLVLEGVVLPGRPLPYVDRTVATARSIARNEGVAAARRWWFETAEFFDVIRADPVACRAAAHWDIIAAFEGGPWTCAMDSVAPDLAARLSDIRTPTLLVNGARDVPDFLDVATILANGLPHADRAIVADAGGFPLWERPRSVNGLVDAWLTKD